MFASRLKWRRAISCRSGIDFCDSGLDPSPFYYFDEVDQNLDGDNSYRIADMCRQRSKQAQFIMVTLRKVSLGLADHHIGITHGGDGCSRRIMDFDRERAIQVGEEARIEQEAAMKQNKILSSESQAFQDAMPSVQKNGYSNQSRRVKLL